MSAATLTVRFAEVPALVGRDLPASEWLEVSQDQINRFADVTADHQWIHVDVERAAREIGGPIAHGFLTLSLLPALGQGTLRIEGAGRSINYGLNRVRFVAPVPAGSRVRLLQKIVSVEKRDTGLLITRECTIEIDGQERPALVAQSLALIFP